MELCWGLVCLIFLICNRCDTIHNQLNYLLGESKLLQSQLQKFPINRVISLFKVNLEHKDNILPLLFVHVMNYLLGNHSIIICPLIRNETTLKGANDGVQVRPYSVYKNFRNKFEKNIAQTNKPKVLEGSRIISLMN